jgi:predicted secreted Zn-dependent protease
VLAAIGLAAPAFAQPSATPDAPNAFAGIPNVTFQYYDVAGADWYSINASLNRAGPRHGNGEVAHGRTDYRIAPVWQELRRGAHCEVTGVEVQFSAVVMLPRLAEQAAIAPALLERWQQSFALLERHEAGHARIALAHIDEVKAAILASHCGEERTNAAAVLDHIEALQQDYDRRTRNGHAQGDIVQ